MIEIVRNWLSATQPGHETVIPSGSVIAKRYRLYRADLPAWCARLLLNPRRLTFLDQRASIIAWLRMNSWTPAV